MEMQYFTQLTHWSTVDLSVMHLVPRMHNLYARVCTYCFTL